MPEHTPGPTLSRGVYGFAMHLTFKFTFIFYIIWALIPENWFVNIGITYFPQRYWAVAVPIFILTVLALFAFIIYPSLGLLMTPNIDDIDTIMDTNSRYATPHLIADENQQENNRKVPCVCRNQTFCMKHVYDQMDDELMHKNAIPDMNDLHIEDVCEDLYL